MTMNRLFQHVMKRTRTLAAAATAFCVLLVMQAGSAQASLINDTVGCSDTGFLDCNPASAVVGAGSEFLQYGGNIGIDVGASQVTLNHLLAGTTVIDIGGSILTLSDLDWIGDPGAFVSGFAINTISGVNGLTAGDLSFTADSVSIDLDQTTFFDGASATFDITFTHTVTVPEPATIGLFGLGLLGVAGATRRRRKAA